MSELYDKIIIFELLAMVVWLLACFLCALQSERYEINSIQEIQNYLGAFKEPKEWYLSDLQLYKYQFFSNIFLCCCRDAIEGAIVVGNLLLIINCIWGTVIASKGHQAIYSPDIVAYAQFNPKIAKLHQMLVDQLELRYILVITFWIWIVLHAAAPVAFIIWQRRRRGVPR